MNISEQDRKLLAILQQDGQISNQALAEKAGMSASACWRRVRALEESGVIKRYAALVDHRKAGIEFHAIVLISLERQNRKQVTQFIEAITAKEEIIECLAATGDADFHLRVACTDQQAFNHLLDDFLFELPSVSRIHTHLILKEIKQGLF
ncbi:Lrp/AsnC family transcriptional regulator [Granulosicoccus antarcticus]|uniref:Leucine-responsive regulatory protein n=1 Tax=Granulosicoccus antarcticus IMCC3135 TaxID=1192854 RepID=A0A2Z2NYC8_9GAMM|nr:Lrp/AsnC family transcriptional regulator [Granulosicoccus antarcticus]ASJ76313.1 Leucine-responsive regulatory protein [Granulosicoccus antarcticus IMCC3135]